MKPIISFAIGVATFSVLQIFLGPGTRVWWFAWRLDHEDRRWHWPVFCGLRCHYGGGLRVLPETERSCQMRRLSCAWGNRRDDHCPIPHWPGELWPIVIAFDGAIIVAAVVVGTAIGALFRG